MIPSGRPDTCRGRPDHEPPMPTPLERIYDAMCLPLYRYFYGQVGNREDAEDLTGEVFLKASRLLDTSRDEASQRAWLWRASRTAVADYWRRFYRAAVTPLEGDPAPRALADGPGDASAKLARLADLLARLPENYRRVLELRFLESCSVRDTAAAMGLSPGNVKVLQYRAVQRAAELGLVAEAGPGGGDERAF